MSGARYFDGVDDYLTVPETSAVQFGGATEFTMSGWVHPVSSSAAQKFFGRWRGGGGGSDAERLSYLAQISADGTFLAAIYTGSFGIVESPAVVTVGVWSHVAMAWDGGTMRLYVDGTEVNTQSRTGTMLDGLNVPLMFGVSGRPLGLEDPFEGRLADWAIWNATLTAANMADLAAQTIRPSALTTGLRGYWPIEGIASPEPDLSTFANDATVVGAVQADGPFGPVGPVGPFLRTTGGYLRTASGILRPA